MDFPYLQQQIRGFQSFLETNSKPSTKKIPTCINSTYKRKYLAYVYFRGDTFGQKVVNNYLF